LWVRLGYRLDGIAPQVSRSSGGQGSFVPASPQVLSFTTEEQYDGAPLSQSSPGLCAPVQFNLEGVAWQPALPLLISISSSMARFRGRDYGAFRVKGVVLTVLPFPPFEWGCNSLCRDLAGGQPGCYVNWPQRLRNALVNGRVSAEPNGFVVITPTAAVGRAAPNMNRLGLRPSHRWDGGRGPYRPQLDLFRKWRARHPLRCRVTDGALQLLLPEQLRSPGDCPSQP